MADSKEVLRAKLQRSTVTIRDLEEQKKYFQNKVMESEQTGQLVDKKARLLSETIIKRTQDAKKGADRREEKNWPKMQTQEILDEAQSRIETYFSSFQKKLDMLMKLSTDRGKEIILLNGKIDQMEKTKDEVKDAQEQAYQEKLKSLDKLTRELTELIKTNGEGDGTLKKVGELRRVLDNAQLTESDKEAFFNAENDLGFIDDDTEDDDLLAQTLKQKAKGDGVRPEVKAGKKPAAKKNPVQGPEVTVAHEDEKIAKAYEDTVENYEETLDELKKGMDEGDILILQVIGEQGFSQIKDVKEYIFHTYSAKEREKNKIRSNSKVSTFFTAYREGSNDKKHKILQFSKISAPGKGGAPIFYKLNNLGISLYEDLFQTKPVISEWEELVKHHTSLEHGYGIKQAAQYLREYEVFQKHKAKIEYLTRKKECMMPVKTDAKVGDPQVHFVIPDIVVGFETKGKDAKYYYEYETGDCKTGDFIAKCNKMVQLTSYLNFIVPNLETARQLVTEVEAWTAQLTPETKARINITTMESLKNQTEELLEGQQTAVKLPWNYMAQYKNGKLYTDREIPESMVKK